MFTKKELLVLATACSYAKCEWVPGSKEHQRYESMELKCMKQINELNECTHKTVFEITSLEDTKADQRRFVCKRCGDELTHNGCDWEKV